MATEYGERLKAARRHAKLTQIQLSKLTGLAQSTISTAERLGNGSSDTTTYAITCGVNPYWLETGKGAMVDAKQASAQKSNNPDKPSGFSNVVPASMGTRRIPVISSVQAGAWAEIVDTFEPGDGSDWLLTDLDLSGCAFALVIEGDSMLPDFKQGDRIIVDPDVAPLPGDFVVARNGHEEATFKKYRPRGMTAAGHEVFELVPLNEDYATLRSDIEPIKIIGTMMEHRKYRRR